MARFCEFCGTPYEEGTTFCSNCGKNVNASPVPQQRAPQYGNPAPQNAVNSPAVSMLKQYLMIIVAVVAVFALIAGIMNLFGTYDITQTVDYGSYGGKDENSGSLSDFRDEMDDMYGAYILSTYLMGLVGLAVAGLAGCTVYLLYSKAPKSKLFFSLTGIVGTAGSGLALLLALIGRTEVVDGWGAEIVTSLSINFTYFVMLLLCGGLLALDLTVFKKNYAPLKK